jgi:hypothetical protein
MSDPRPADQPRTFLSRRLLPWHGVLIEPGREPIAHPPRRSASKPVIEQPPIEETVDA